MAKVDYGKGTYNQNWNKQQLFKSNIRHVRLRGHHHCPNIDRRSCCRENSKDEYEGRRLLVRKTHIANNCGHKAANYEYRDAPCSCQRSWNKHKDCHTD